MRILEYYLEPESGYDGIYEKKDGHLMIKHGTVADLIHDSKMLWISNYNKIIPNISDLNALLRKGYFPRSAEWDAFEIDKVEYDEIVTALLSINMPKPYHIN